MRKGLLLLRDGVHELIEGAAALGYEGVEIAVGNSVDGLSSVATRVWRQRCDDLGLYMAAHAPSMDIRLDSANDGIRRESMRQIFACLTAFDGAIDYLTIHTGFVRRYAKLGALERVVMGLRELSSAARSWGTTICVENVFESSIDEMLNYIDLADCSNLRMTLDVAHAMVYGGFDPKVAAPIIGDLIRNVHLSDNDGVSDQHLPIGRGIMPIAQVLTGFRSAGYDGCVTVEARSLAEAEESLRAVTRMLAQAQLCV